MRLFMCCLLQVSVNNRCESNVPFEKIEETEEPALSLQYYMMATKGFRAATFVGTFEDAFFFEVGEPGCRFNIQFYHKNPDREPGKAVMLYSNKDGKKKVVSCSNEHQVCAEEMDLPGQIEENANKAIFYQVKVELTTSKFMFESSLYPSWFLGLEPDEKNPSLRKLVLHHKGDEVDEACQFQALST